MKGRVERLPRDLANRHAPARLVADRVLVVGERVGEREFTRRLAELAADPLLVRRSSSTASSCHGRSTARRTGARSHPPFSGRSARHAGSAPSTRRGILKRAGRYALMRSWTNIASVPVRCGHNWACSPGARSRGRDAIDSTTARGVDARHLRMLAEGGVHDAAGLGGVRRAGRIGEQSAGLERGSPIRAAATEGRRAPRRRRSASAIWLLAGAAALRDRCMARRGGSGRMRRDPARPTPSRRTRRPRPRRRTVRRPVGRARRERERARSRRGAPHRSGPSAASSAALPPGPAQRSSQRSPARIGRARLSASATSAEPSSWTRARPSANRGYAAGSPDAATTPSGDARPGVPPSSSIVERPGSAVSVTEGGRCQRRARPRAHPRAPRRRAPGGSPARPTPGANSGWRALPSPDFAVAEARAVQASASSAEIVRRTPFTKRAPTASARARPSRRPRRGRACASRAVGGSRVAARRGRRHRSR